MLDGDKPRLVGHLQRDDAFTLLSLNSCLPVSSELESFL